MWKSWNIALHKTELLAKGKLEKSQENKKEKNTQNISKHHDDAAKA